MEPIKLKTIEEEAADCRAAFEGSQIGDLVNFCHHQVIIENLSEPAEDRIAYILKDKSHWERALRLRLFRPIQRPQDIPWPLANALKALTKALLNYRKEVQEYGADYDVLDGLRRAYGVVQEKALKDYPFEKIFGVEWKGDIFDTFEYENVEEK